MQWQAVEGFVAAIPEEPVDEGLLEERGIPGPRWAVNGIADCYLLLIPSGPQKCFHFSEINNSVTYISKIMRLSYFNTYMIKFPIVNSFFFKIGIVFYEQLSKKLEQFFFCLARDYQ